MAQCACWLALIFAGLLIYLPTYSMEDDLNPSDTNATLPLAPEAAIFPDDAVEANVTGVANVTDASSAVNQTIVLKVHRRLVRKTTTTTTTEDPRLLGLTLDPRLEVDTLGLDAVMIPKDHLGASILGTIELHRMSRMADIPLAMTRIGPAPPVPPAPVEPAPIRSPPVAPAGPNYLSLYYLSLANRQQPRRPMMMGFGGGMSGGGGASFGGGGGGD